MRGRNVLGVLLVASALLAGNGVDAATPTPGTPRIVDAIDGSAPLEAARTVRQALGPLATQDAAAALLRLAHLAGIQPASEVTDVAATTLDDVPPQIAPALDVLLDAVAVATAHVELALAGLPREELIDLHAGLGDAREAARVLASGSEDAAAAAIVERYRRSASRVSLEDLLRAELTLVDAAKKAWRLLGDADPPSAPGACASGNVVFEDPTCSIVVGDEGANTYDSDAVVLVDLGGSDTYRNNAGGAGLLMPAAVLLDLGESPDQYSSPQGEAEQGSAFAGAGLLVDSGGADTYSVPIANGERNARTFAQGSAAFGAGVLWDRGSATDRYTSRNIAQGGVLTGIALLLDEGGSDTYAIPYTFDSEGGQGTGCFGGFGALLDQGEGADVYDAAIDDMQGFGCAGGLGVLFDAGGNDAYVLRSGDGLIGILEPEQVRQSGWGQGYGELGGVGILVDVAGSDTYLAESLAAATYEGYNVQGAGVGAGAGFLIDLGGPDSYTARTNCQGWGTAGLGVLDDLGTTQDSYVCAAPDVGVRADDNAWASGSAGFGSDR